LHGHHRGSSSIGSAAGDNDVVTCDNAVHTGWQHLTAWSPLPLRSRRGAPPRRPGIHRNVTVCRRLTTLTAPPW
jgi:hypothetical protein